jgi:hypothetical protein
MAALFSQADCMVGTDVAHRLLGMRVCNRHAALGMACGTEQSCAPGRLHDTCTGAIPPQSGLLFLYVTEEKHPPREQGLTCCELYQKKAMLL